MNILLKTLARKPSVQPSTGGTAAQAQAPARPTAPPSTAAPTARTTTAAPPAPRSSHIFSIPPAEGMYGILVDSGVQMTIEYLREVPYHGPPPAHSPAIVRPKPPAYRAGGQLALFVDGRHFLARIVAVAPYASAGAGVGEDAPPRIGTYIFDFPTPAGGIDLALPGSFSESERDRMFEECMVNSGLNPQATTPTAITTTYPTPPRSTSQDASPSPGRKEGAAERLRDTEPGEQRTRALTLSTAAQNISQTDQEAFQRVQDGFLARGPALVTPKDALGQDERQHEMQLRPPTTPSRRPSTSSVGGTGSRSAAQMLKNAPVAPPSPTARQGERALSGMQRAGRTRTASAAAVPTILEERRTLLRPSGSAQPVAVRSTTTPAPRQRLHSDAGVRHQQSSASLMRAQTAQAQAQQTARPVARKPVPSAAQGEPQNAHAPTKSGMFAFGTGKSRLGQWANSVTLSPFHFMGGGAAAGDGAEKATAGRSQFPLRAPPNQMFSLTSESTGPPDQREVSWVSYDMKGAGYRQPMTDESVDPLSTSNSVAPRPRQRAHSQSYSYSQQASTGASTGRNKGKSKDSGSAEANGVVRVTLDASPRPSVGPALSSTLSRAESRRFSARKELPPIPITSPFLLSPKSLVRSQIAEEKEKDEGQPGASKFVKSLGDALELTPPTSAASSSSSHAGMASASASGSSQGQDAHAPRTPDSAARTRAPHDSLRSSSASPAITPNARLTTFQIKPLTRERAQIYAAPPTPPRLGAARLPGGSSGAHPASVALSAAPDAVVPLDGAGAGSGSTLSLSLAAARDQYDTAPSSVGAASTDSGSWDRTVGSVDSTHLPRAAKMSGTARAWLVPKEEVAKKSPPPGWF